MAPEWISIKCAWGVCVCVCKSKGKKNKKMEGGLAQSLAVSGSPGRGGGAVASEVAYQQCAQERGRVTECVRRSGRGWEASFKARCSSGEEGLFYNHLLFGVFSSYFFFFSRGNNSKKKKATDTWSPAVREKKRWGSERRGGEEGGGTGRWRGVGRSVWPERLGPGEGARGVGRSCPAALPCPSSAAASWQVPGARPLHPVLLLPPPPHGWGGEGEGGGCGFLEVVVVAFSKNPVNCVSYYFCINSFFCCIKTCFSAPLWNPPEVAPGTIGRG